MRNHRRAVLAFADDFGLLQILVGISVGLLCKLLGVFAGFIRSCVGDQVRKFFVANLNAASRVACLLFGFCGDGYDFVAFPENFLAGFGHDLDGFYSRHFFCGAGINAHDLGMRVG